MQSMSSPWYKWSWRNWLHSWQTWRSQKFRNNFPTVPRNSEILRLFIQIYTKVLSGSSYLQAPKNLFQTIDSLRFQINHLKLWFFEWFGMILNKRQDVENGIHNAKSLFLMTVVIIETLKGCFGRVGVGCDECILLTHDSSKRNKNCIALILRWGCFYCRVYPHHITPSSTLPSSVTDFKAI